MRFRFDRLATLYVANPLRRFSTNGASIPILMYHSICNDPETDVRPYYRISTSPAVFMAQMQCLHDDGYHAVTLNEAIDQLEKGTKLEKLVVITFDDGYQDFYRQAFPILNRFGFKAIVYLPTAFIGDQSLPFNRRNCMTWSEVRELQKHGITFGSHTVNHPLLYDLGFADIKRELSDSKKTIEDKLGYTVDAFAYPYAFPQTDSAFRKELRNTLCETGYQSNVCTTVGRARHESDPFFLERLPVNSGDDDALFEAKLAGAYDWIAKPQHVIKVMKSRVRRGKRSTAPPVINHSSVRCS